MFYIHALACFFWMVIEKNAPTQYYLYEEDGSYISRENEFYVEDGQEEAFKTANIEQAVEIKWGKSKTFREVKASLPDYMLSEPINWYLPTEWINYSDQTIFSNSGNKKYNQFSRYLTMVYESVLIIGYNEFGPVNLIEFIYLSITLGVSVFMSTLIFTNIGVLAEELNQNSKQR